MKCIKIDNMLRTARLIVLAVLSGGIFAVPCGIYAQSAPRTVSGTVTDAATGEPLIGATVQVKGVTIGTTISPERNVFDQPAGKPENTAFLLCRV